MQEIKVTHENGYTGILYGTRSMVILKDNKEVLHTGFRDEKIKTEKDLYKFLEEIPELLKNLDKILDENDEEEI